MNLQLPEAISSTRRYNYARVKKSLGDAYYYLASKDFWTFRLLMHPEIMEAWWQEDVANHLNQFWKDYEAGRRPKLVLGAPPQHGKSELMRDFACWVAGRNPNIRIIFASYNDQLGIGANLHLQRLLQLPAYQATFPATKISEVGVHDPDRSRRTTNFIEFVGKRGSFRNTTVDGKINGFGLDIGIIDDPIKGRAEAQSKTIRDKTWSWLTDDFFLRFADSAGIVMIMTRWHVDDPVGRWMEKFPGTKVINYPAVAEENEFHDLGDRTVLRRQGEALFPEHKSIEFLEERRQVLTQASWEALYQQHPIVVGGGIFPIEKMLVLPGFSMDMVRRAVRYVDKAGTEGGEGARTAMVLLYQLKDGRFVIADVVKGRWSALERETMLKNVAKNDRSMLGTRPYEVGIEQEPGSGGKESAEASIRNLAGFRAFADKVTGSKEVRAEPFAAQVQNNNVRLIAGSWIPDYLEEAENFPNGKCKDQIDATVGAFNRMTSMPVYNLDAMQ